jgi:hypothetical protein
MGTGRVVDVTTGSIVARQSGVTAQAASLPDPCARDSAPAYPWSTAIRR